MNDFTKTIIVDASLTPPFPPNTYNSIYEATLNSEIVANGGTIIVEAGIYEIDGTSGKESVSIPSNTTIIGRGNVVININNSNIQAFNAAGKSNIRISGFKINVTIAANSYNSEAIYLYNVKNSILEKLTITATNSQTNIGNAAIYLQNDECCVVSKCFVNGYQSGISLMGSYGACIKNNYFKSSQVNLFSRQASNCSISTNVFSKATYMHMNLELGHDLSIYGNQVNETNGSHGIYTSGCEGVSLLGNIIADSMHSGLHVRFGCSSKPEEGQVCPVDNLVCDKYYTVVGNVMYHNGYGTDGNGIHFQAYAQSSAIAGNSCVDNHNNGIRLQDQDDIVPAKNNVVSGNLAVLHDGFPNDDKPISVEHLSNIEATNLTYVPSQH